MKKVLALCWPLPWRSAWSLAAATRLPPAGSAEGTATGSSNVTVQLGPNPETLDPAAEQRHRRAAT